MKFNTTPRKIDYSTNQNQSNENEIDNENRINNQNDNLISQKQPSSSLFKFIKDLSSDWEPMEIPQNDYNAGIINQLKGWTINIDRIDERFIPYIDATILYRNAGNIGVPYLLEDAQKNVFFEVKDITGEETLKNLSIHAGIYLNEPIPIGTVNDFEARLIVKLSDKLNFT